MASTSPHGGSLNADPVVEFRKIVQAVLRTAAESYGVEDIEPGLEQALAFLRENRNLRKEFEAELISLLDSPQEGMVELISFVMHDLRWEGIQEEIKSRVRHPGDNVSNLRLYEAILDAFSDSWRDRDLYSRYLR